MVAAFSVLGKARMMPRALAGDDETLVVETDATNDGFRVITVWDSEEQYNQFRDEKLVPALQEVSGGAVEGPGAEVQQVHKYLTA